MKNYRQRGKQEKKIRKIREKNSYRRMESGPNVWRSSKRWDDVDLRGIADYIFRKISRVVGESKRIFFFSLFASLHRGSMPDKTCLRALRTCGGRDNKEEEKKMEGTKVRPRHRRRATLLSYIGCKKKTNDRSSMPPSLLSHNHLFHLFILLLVVVIVVVVVVKAQSTEPLSQRGNRQSRAQAPW